MATSTTTIRTTTTTFASCARECDERGVFSFRAVYDGYRACRRRKRGTANAQRYELRLLDHLVDTARTLQDRTYAPSRSLCFVARQPKAREIHAADFRDRVVHHVLVPRLEALFEPIFIHDLYSNRLGKGTHAAVERLAHFMRAASSNGQQPAWSLQLDVRNFFNSIDQAQLFRLVNRRLKKAVQGGRLSDAEAWDLSWLTRVILKQDLASETSLRCTPAELARVPAHKRLSSAPPGKGLPIGNLTSQFFGNVYLNALDQFVKHQLRCRYYLRYVDDMILIDRSPAQLRAWEQQIEQYLAEELELALKPERRLRVVTDGADFLGYIVRPQYRLVRRRVVGNLREKLAAFERAQVSDHRLRLPSAARDALRSTLASYLGHFQHAETERLIHQLFNRYPWLGWLFRRPRGGQLRPNWQPISVTSLRSQVDWFRQSFAADLPLNATAPPLITAVQLGNRVALFGDDAERTQQRLPWAWRWRSMRHEQRQGLGEGVSWPLTHLKGLGRGLRHAGLPYLFVAEEGYLPGGMKRRVLRDLHIGPGAYALPRVPA